MRKSLLMRYLDRFREKEQDRVMLDILYAVGVIVRNKMAEIGQFISYPQAEYAFQLSRFNMGYERATLIHQLKEYDRADQVRDTHLGYQILHGFMVLLDAVRLAEDDEGRDVGFLACEAFIEQQLRVEPTEVLFELSRIIPPPEVGGELRRRESAFKLLKPEFPKKK